MPLIVLLRKQKDNMSQDGVPALMVSDMVTMLTAMLEQKMYTNRADPMLALRFTLVGIVSRIVETILQKISRQIFTAMGKSSIRIKLSFSFSTFSCP